MTRRVLPPLAGALAIAAIIIALLAPNHGNSPLDPVAQAADTTAAAGSAEFGLAGTITVNGQTIPLNGNGAIDMRNHAMRMDVSMPLPGMGSLQMQELLSGTTFYIHMPDQLASRMPGGKSWMKLDLQALSKSSGVDFKQLMQANQGNPADMLQALKGAGSSQVVGHEDVNGDPTMHYHATIDLTKALDRIPDKQIADSLRQMFAARGMGSLPIDVWIDRSGRVRREAINFTTGTMSMQMTISFTRFGVTVDTTPPPADQVLDAGALLNSVSGATTSG